MTGVSEMVEFDTFAAAAAEKTDDEQVCGTYRGDSPVYFLMPASATDDQIREAAFCVREGRPVSDYERTMFALARKIHEEQPA